MTIAPAIWITGLPASGKSTLAKALADELARHQIHATIIESDAARKIITPDPTYDEPERDLFYAAITYAAMLLTQRGVPTIIDATGNRRAYRDRARELIPAFIEIFVDCPRQVCVARDTKGIYALASNAQSNNIPGAGAPYERPILPEFLVNGDRTFIERTVQEWNRQRSGVSDVLGLLDAADVPADDEALQALVDRIALRLARVPGGPGAETRLAPYMSTIAGLKCWIKGAWAPSTSKVSVPPDLRPAGKRIDSGEETWA